MEAKRALFFVSGYRPEMFGIGRYIPDYAEALAQAGWSVEVFAPYPFYPSWVMDRSVPSVTLEADGRICVRRYAPYVPRHPAALGRALHEGSLGLQAFRALRGKRTSADVVVAASPPLLAAVASVTLARRMGLPSVVLAYDLVGDLATDAFGPLTRFPAGGVRALEGFMYRRAHSVIALTDDMADRIRRISGRIGQVPVIRIWADEALFQRDYSEAARQFREACGIGERPLIGFAGNFGRKQHLSRIVEAVAGLSGEHVTVFVGDGPDRPVLEAAAHQCADRVRVLAPQPSEKLHAFLTACDISVVIAWTRNAGSLFPSKVSNILAAGCPIVAVTPPDSELGKLIEHEKLGLVCSSLGVSELRAALETGAKMGRCPERRARCRAYAARHFDKRIATSRFVDELERVVTRATLDASASLSTS